MPNVPVQGRTRKRPTMGSADRKGSCEIKLSREWHLDRRQDGVFAREIYKPTVGIGGEQDYTYFASHAKSASAANQAALDAIRHRPDPRRFLRDARHHRLNLSPTRSRKAS